MSFLLLLCEAFQLVACPVVEQCGHQQEASCGRGFRCGEQQHTLTVCNEHEQPEGHEREQREVAAVGVDAK